MNKPKKNNFFGHPRSGNHWLRFIILNYLNDEPFDFNDIKREFRAKHRIIKNGICIIRNPKDVAESYYHFCKNRVIPFWLLYPDVVESGKLNNKNYFVKKYTKIVQEFNNKAIIAADYVIKYSDMRKDTYKTIENLFKFLGWKVDKKKLKRAIELSNFENVKEISLNCDAWSTINKDFEFCRKG